MRGTTHFKDDGSNISNSKYQYNINTIIKILIFILFCCYVCWNELGGGFVNVGVNERSIYVS